MREPLSDPEPSASPPLLSVVIVVLGVGFVGVRRLGGVLGESTALLYLGFLLLPSTLIRLLGECMV